MSTPDAPRRAAFDVLRAVDADGAYSNLVLPATLRSRGITGRDAAFATELVAGTLRGRGTYDAILDSLVSRSPDAAVRDALRLGTHQILAMRTPAHAAVATTVELVRAAIGHGPAGFVNAVLRRVAADDLDGWVRRLAPDPVTDPTGHAAFAYSHPRWVVDALRDAVGADELDALLVADNLPPKVTLVALPGLADPAELGGTPSTRSPYAVTLEGGDPGDLAAVAEGRARVQDEGSQIVTIAFAEAAVDGRDERWLDMCAGPGGKTALLAALAASRGARVLASERLPHRAGLVRGAVPAVRDGMSGVVVADGTVPPWPAETFDRVLVDAPCSGLGALRRRPESRWRRTPEDVAALVRLQRALVDAAIDTTRPGGVVGYVTCTPVLAETAGVVGAVLAGRDDVVLDPVEAGTGPLPGTVQLWPHRDGTDAMFLALLRRR
jgi:16S rRNA (cytosine967-C5)-methyltransferase